jgi:hypothetical protein
MFAEPRQVTKKNVGHLLPSFRAKRSEAEESQGVFNATNARMMLFYKTNVSHLLPSFRAQRSGAEESQGYLMLLIPAWMTPSRTGTKMLLYKTNVSLVLTKGV